MKFSILPVFSLLIVASHSSAQEGDGRLFEKIVRGLAHAVTSENGSSLVPPPIPYDQRPAESRSARTAQQPQPRTSDNRSWFQPPEATRQPRQEVPSYAERTTSPPRVIRQQQAPSSQLSGPFANWYQAPEPRIQPRAEPRTTQQRSVTPRLNGFTPFQNWQAPPVQGHDRHDDHDHSSHSRPQAGSGFFGNRPSSSGPLHTGDRAGYQGHHDRHDQHGHHDRHDHHGHESHQRKDPPRVIAIRSQFQPFSIFQGQQNQRIISSRAVRPVPNQGTIVWLKSR